MPCSLPPSLSVCPVPRQTSSFSFNINHRLIEEKVLLRVCNFDRSKREQSDYLSCRLNVYVNGSMVFAGVSHERKLLKRSP